MDRMRLLTGDGPVWVDVENDADASDIGTYWNAVRTFLRTGDDVSLSPFEGQPLGGVYPLTDLDGIEYWALRGELEFEDIYEGS